MSFLILGVFSTLARICPTFRPGWYKDILVSSAFTQQWYPTNLTISYTIFNITTKIKIYILLPTD